MDAYAVYQVLDDAFGDIGPLAIEETALPAIETQNISRLRLLTNNRLSDAELEYLTHDLILDYLDNRYPFRKRPRRSKALGSTNPPSPNAIHTSNQLPHGVDPEPKPVRNLADMSSQIHPEAPAEMILPDSVRTAIATSVLTELDLRISMLDHDSLVKIEEYMTVCDHWSLHKLYVDHKFTADEISIIDKWVTLDNITDYIEKQLSSKILDIGGDEGPDPEDD